MGYREFIASKRREMKPFGFTPGALNDNLFPWQSRVVTWSVQRGRAALFEECGLGKTIQQLEWAAHVCKHTGGNVVIHTPVAVRHQTQREAERFGIDVAVNVVNEQADVKRGISLVNYEKLHKIAPESFAGVVLDESSILKNFTGVTKRRLIEAYSQTSFRLACTATPAPNDFMELGNHAEFLGIMPSNEMLSRWFINDTMKAGGYRLRRHGEGDFWDWVASWAVCLERPSDIGGDDTGFILPKLTEIEHVIDDDLIKPPSGHLFFTGSSSATAIHAEKRATAELRAARLAELVNGNDERWVVWCDTNYESESLGKLIADCVEVRGTDSEADKERKLDAFSEGKVRVIVTKPTIAGFGMNWQHCCRVAFIGLSYSYEQYYQALRRVWRFGQRRPVESHLINSVSEESATRAIRRKAAEHERMRSGMSAAMRKAQGVALRQELRRDKYEANKRMEIPPWLQK